MYIIQLQYAHYRMFYSCLRLQQACHAAGIAHRDLKADNLLLREDRRGPQKQGNAHGTLWISDFGLSKRFQDLSDSNGEVLLETPCGTLKYAAPEIFKKMAYEPKAIDIWACGVILHTMVAGKFPWTEATEACSGYSSYLQRDGEFAWPYWLSTGLLDLLQGMLLVDPGHRWSVEQALQCEWCLPLPGDSCGEALIPM